MTTNNHCNDCIKSLSHDCPRHPKHDLRRRACGEFEGERVMPLPELCSQMRVTIRRKETNHE